MDLTALIIQLISGAIGGNAVGAAAKESSLGPLGNTIAGALGGGIGGQILSSVLGLGGAAAASGAIRSRQPSVIITAPNGPKCASGFPLRKAARWIWGRETESCRGRWRRTAGMC